MIYQYQLPNNLRNEDVYHDNITLPENMINKKGLFCIDNQFWNYYIGYTNNLVITTYKLIVDAYTRPYDLLTRGINAMLTFGGYLQITYDDNDGDPTLLNDYINYHQPIFNNSSTLPIIVNHSRKITQAEKSQLMKNGMRFKYITGDNDYVYYLANDLLIYGIIRNKEAENNV